jgi:hypothetical protein
VEVTVKVRWVVAETGQGGLAAVALVVCCWFVVGMLVGATHAALARAEGRAVSADALTAFSILWPLAVPDLLFRLVTGRWFGRRRPE